LIKGFFAAASSQQNPALWAPMAHFDLSSATDNNATNVVEEGLTALIDTGSDYCRIDAALALKHSLTQIRTIPDRSGGSTSIVKVYSLQIILDGGQKLSLQCPSGSLRSGGFPFDFLLGMDAIGHFELVVARPRQEVTLRRL
jgi:hypothetical protein